MTDMRIYLIVNVKIFAHQSHRASRRASLPLSCCCLFCIRRSVNTDFVSSVIKHEFLIMSALQLLQVYESESENGSSDEEFIGLDDLSGDRFLSSTAKYDAICQALESAVAAGYHPGDKDVSNADLVLNETCESVLERSSQSEDGSFCAEAEQQIDSESDSGGEEDLESDGNNLITDQKRRKWTVKEKLRMHRAKKRRLKHDVIIDGCGCKKKCDQIFSKEERLNIHERFWKLRFSSKRISCENMFISSRHNADARTGLLRMGRKRSFRTCSPSVTQTVMRYQFVGSSF